MSWDASRYHGPEARLWECAPRYDTDAAYKAESPFAHPVTCGCWECAGADEDDELDYIVDELGEPLAA